MEKLKTIIKKLLIITLYFCLTSNTALANTYKETNKELFSVLATGKDTIYIILSMIKTINYIRCIGTMIIII